MNKTLSIGLAGFSFIIEEHAYIKLSDYLSALRSSLDAAEADEVMHDIEIRMVEIFKDSLGKREVINTDDVERVIAQIGKPEQIEEQENAYYSDANAKTAAGKTTGGQKQLFRDPTQAKIAGVCAGLAHYTGLDVRLIRGILLAVILLDVFFTLAISTSLLVIIYIILWIVLPKAETASDFLKMKGAPVNFDTLKAESNKIVQFANDSTQKVGEIYDENRPYINKAGNGIGNALRYILGALFAFISISSLMGLFAVFGIIGVTKNGLVGIDEFYFNFGSEMSLILKALITLATLIPALLFGLVAIKLLSPKTKVRNVGYVLGGLFLAIIALGTYLGVNIAQKEMKYKGVKEDTENIALNSTSDTILADVKNVVIPSSFEAYDNDLFSDKKSVFRMDHPYIDVTRKANIKTPYLIVKKEAEGYNLPMDMKVPVEISGNTIFFPNFIQYPYANRARDYHVNYELVVPMAAKIVEVRENKLTLEDEDENDDPNTNSGSTVSINSGSGQSVVVSSSMQDSIIVNGKKYRKDVAEKMLDSMNFGVSNLKDANISIKNGKKEISIKNNR